MTKTSETLTHSQLEALQLFALANGRTWKAALRTAWMNGYHHANLGKADSAQLQHLRNSAGPKWLIRFSLPKALAALPQCNCGEGNLPGLAHCKGCPRDERAEALPTAVLNRLATDSNAALEARGELNEANAAPQYRVEVIADNSGKWWGNAMTFGSVEAAKEHAVDLMWRWILVRDWRVVNDGEVVAARGVE